MKRKEGNASGAAAAQNRGKEPETKVVFANISGGFAGGGMEPARLNPERKMIRENSPPISFSDADFVGGDMERDPLPMIITVEINDFTVRRVLLNVGSSADILYWPTFQKLGLSPSMLKPYTGDLSDAFGSISGIIGYIDLKTTLGKGVHVDSINIRYLVIDAKSPRCNVVIGRPTFNVLGAILSPAHLTMKYPRPDGKVGVIKADMGMARQCYKEGV